MAQHIFSRSLDDVNVADLRGFYKSDLSAPKVLDIFAARSNDARITTVSSIEATLKGAAFEIRRPQIFHVFKALEKFNCGKFVRENTIVSRANKASRFEWRVSLVAVGRAAADKKIR